MPADDSDRGPSIDALSRIVHADILAASAKRKAADLPHRRPCRHGNDDGDSCRAPVRRTSIRRGVSTRDRGPPTSSRRTPTHPMRSCADPEQMSRIAIIAYHHTAKRLPVAKKHRNALVKICLTRLIKLIILSARLSRTLPYCLSFHTNRSKLWWNSNIRVRKSVSKTMFGFICLRCFAKMLNSIYASKSWDTADSNTNYYNKPEGVSKSLSHWWKRKLGFCRII